MNKQVQKKEEYDFYLKVVFFRFSRRPAPLGYAPRWTTSRVPWRAPALGNAPSPNGWPPSSDGLSSLRVDGAHGTYRQKVLLQQPHQSKRLGETQRALRVGKTEKSGSEVKLRFIVVTLGEAQLLNKCVQLFNNTQLLEILGCR